MLIILVHFMILFVQFKGLLIRKPSANSMDHFILNVKEIGLSLRSSHYLEIGFDESLLLEIQQSFALER